MQIEGHGERTRIKYVD